MEQAEIELAQALETSVKKNANRLNIILFPTSALLATVAAMVPRWHNFDPITKFIAVLFMLLLVTHPFLEILSEHNVRSGVRDRFRYAYPYILVILAIAIFGRS